jgi:hypothetical protein
MQLASIRPGDIVLVNRAGRRFYAEVVGHESDGITQRLVVRPLDRNVTWRSATARQVIGIWHANKGTREGRPRAG